MVLPPKKKSKYKMLESDAWSQWHGASEQARRIIEEIIPYLDEALQKSEANPSTDNLSRYITEIEVFYSNICSVFNSKDEMKAKEYMTKLLHAKREELSGEVSTIYYFSLLDCCNKFDLWLRKKIQNIGLLYRVVQKKNGTQMLRDMIEYSNEESVDDIIRTSPYILSGMDLEAMNEDGDEYEDEE
jgi:hypothetical protein